MTRRRRHLTAAQVVDVAQDPLDRLVTIREASRIVEVNPRTIADWITCGRVPYAVLGHRIVVPLLAVADVEWELRAAGRGRPRRVAC